MRGMFAAYPVLEGEDYDQYVARTLGGAAWDGQMTEFGAALTYDAAHLLCPEHADFMDDLAGSE